jgi:hypothetical protein
MITIKGDCVTLEGVACSGELSLGRWFCPRGVYEYWRESWLKRVPGAHGGADRSATLDDPERPCAQRA